jgi:hypothetical protein
MDDAYSYLGMWIIVIAVIVIHRLPVLIEFTRLLLHDEHDATPAPPTHQTRLGSRAAEPAAQPEPQHLWARPGWKPPR